MLPLRVRMCSILRRGFSSDNLIGSPVISVDQVFLLTPPNRCLHQFLGGLFVFLVATGCGGPSTTPGENQGAIPETHTPSTKIDQQKNDQSEAVAKDATFKLVQVLPDESNVDFVHVSGNSPQKPFPAANGSGMGMLDFDLDGKIDLYFATGRSFPLDDAESRPNRIYRNLGDWKFQDATLETGLDLRAYAAGVTVGDLNSDGFPDVYVTCFGPNHLFLNQGDGTFEKHLMASGGHFSTSAAMLDFDADGLLDLYVGNYGDWTFETNRFCGDRTRDVRIFCSPTSLEPAADCLLRNQGDESFVDVTTAAGLDQQQQKGRAQGVMATDVNSDGRVDIYIGNDITPNFLLINSEQGQFTSTAEITGTAFDRKGQMQAGMGVAGGDVNRDGRWDLFVTNFEDEYHTLYIQNSPTDFHDVSMTHGLAAASRPWVGWGTAFVDFDLDRWSDVIVTNGHVDDNLQDMQREGDYEQPALVWKNIHGRFEFLGASVGSYFQSPHPGRGLATGDLDNDGDWDVVITHQDQHPALLRNDVAKSASGPVKSVSLRLIGTASNRDAIGARVIIDSDESPFVLQVENGGSYLSAHDARLIVPVLDQQSIDLEIYWPSGKTSQLTGLKPFLQYDIVEPDMADSAPTVLIRPS